jgi:hypothetical protein
MRVTSHRPPCRRNRSVKNSDLIFGCYPEADLIKTWAMVRLREDEPAQEAGRCREQRITDAALDTVKQIHTALMVCRYNGKPFPVSLSEESYQHIVALLTQHRSELV